MLVNLKQDGWEVIYHRAHALLAAQIAGYWQLEPSFRLYETIAAISHHDDLEKEWEGNQLTEAGAPLDFTLDEADSIEKMRALVQDALYRSTWVALLTSMHLCYLTGGKAGQPDIDSFLGEQRDLQAQWRAESDISKDQAQSVYNLMRWCDRLSLILCQQQVPDAGRWLDINIGPDGQPYRVKQLDSGHLTVAPWPFQRDQITVHVEACHLSQLQFDSSQQLIQALIDAPRRHLKWTFEQTNPPHDQ